MPRKESLAAVALVALTLLAYAPAMRGGFIWDDDDYVIANPNLRTAQGLWNIWFVPRASPQYYPLVHTSFWIEYQLWGLRAAAYHVVNILLHAAAAMLLWRLLLKLQVPAAWLAAALWAIHPVQAESVAWITERKNVLSALFYFAAGLFYVAWASRPSSSGGTPKPRLYIAALLLFICSLLSKTVTCSLPAALALILWWKHGRITKQHWLSLLPMFAVGVFFAATTVFLEREHVLAKGPEWNFSPLDRILIAGRAVWFYVRTLALPVDLSFIYPRWIIDARQSWQWAFPLGVIVALITLYRMRHRWGRGPLVASLIFVGTLVPALGFFNIYPMRYAFVADHFQYHACAAMLVLLAVAIRRAFGRFDYLFLGPLLLLTCARSAIVSDNYLLWHDTLAKNPNSWMVHLNLAKQYSARGDDAKAQHHFERQVALAPDLPETHWNYGSSLFQRGQLEEAIREYSEAIRLGGAKPLPQAFFARGRVHLHRNSIAEAIADFARAVELKPDYAQAHNYLGTALLRNKQHDAALQEFRRAIDFDPSLAEARVNLAALLAALGRLDEATFQFERAVKINPALEMYRELVLTPPREP